MGETNSHRGSTMYFVYIDESGKPNYNDPDPLYVLTGILVHEQDWRTLDAGITAIKARAIQDHGLRVVVPTSAMEIHTTDLMSGKDHYRGTTLDCRRAVVGCIWEGLQPLDFKIISVAILRDRLRKRIDLNEWAIRLLVERVQIFMGRNCPTENAILIYDSESPRFNEVRRLFITSVLSNGTLFQSRLENIVETPFFVDSSHMQGIQVADFVGYHIRRFIRIHYYGITRNYFDGNLETQIRNNIRTKFDRGELGLKLFPNQDMTPVRSLLNP